jgi:hypothetical protein
MCIRLLCLQQDDKNRLHDGGDIHCASRGSHMYSSLPERSNAWVIRVIGGVHPVVKHVIYTSCSMCKHLELQTTSAINSAQCLSCCSSWSRNNLDTHKQTLEWLDQLVLPLALRRAHQNKRELNCQPLLFEGTSPNYFGTLWQPTFNVWSCSKCGTLVWPPKWGLLIQFWPVSRGLLI